MICISDCFECKHQRDKLLDGWIPCCDAFPDGIPLDFKFGKVKEMKAVSYTHLTLPTNSRV